jgi:hypothetical protein
MGPESSASWMQYLTWFLIGGNLIALVVGMLMFIAPARLDQWMGVSARWFSTRKLLKPLEIPRDADRILLNYPRILGGILILGAAFILIHGGLVVGKIGTEQGARYLALFFSGTNLPPSAWESLWISLVAVICIGATAAATVGVLAAVRAQTLHRISAVANRWLSTRQASKPLDTPYYGVDSLVRAKPRLWGGVIVFLAAYSLVVLVWFTRGW